MGIILNYYSFSFSHYNHAGTIPQTEKLNAMAEGLSSAIAGPKP